MLIHKVAILAGALVVAGAGSAAHAVELGARSIVVEQTENPFALQEQADYLAYHRQFTQPRHTSHIDGIDAADIAKMQGIDEVERVSLNRGAWTVNGTDRLGEEMLVRVNSRGEVLDVSTRVEPLDMCHR